MNAWKRYTGFFSRKKGDKTLAILETQELTYTYSVGTPFEKTAVDHVDLAIEEGEMIGVMGHTGSGKSTLIKLLLKELEPTSGTIVINDKILSQIPMFASSAGTKLPICAISTIRAVCLM